MLLLVVDSRRYERVNKYSRVQEEKHWAEPETGMERYMRAQAGVRIFLIAPDYISITHT